MGGQDKGFVIVQLSHEQNESRICVRVGSLKTRAYERYRWSRGRKAGRISFGVGTDPRELTDVRHPQHST